MRTLLLSVRLVAHDVILTYYLNQSVYQASKQSGNQSIDQPTDPSMDPSIDPLVDGSSHLFIDPSIRRLIIEQSNNHFCG